jgi:hypothetical protein
MVTASELEPRSQYKIAGQAGHHTFLAKRTIKAAKGEPSTFAFFKHATTGKPKHINLDKHRSLEFEKVTPSKNNGSRKRSSSRNLTRRGGRRNKNSTIP